MPYLEKQNKKWDWEATLHNKISKNIRLKIDTDKYHRKRWKVIVVISNVREKHSRAPCTSTCLYMIREPICLTTSDKCLQYLILSLAPNL